MAGAFFTAQRGAKRPTSAQETKIWFPRRTGYVIVMTISRKKEGGETMAQLRPKIVKLAKIIGGVTGIMTKIGRAHV